MNTLERVSLEIVDLHDFFTAWFNGSVERDQLEPRFFSHLHEDIVFIPPEGHLLTGPMLKEGFVKGYGTNPDFRIQIRDVVVRHEIDNFVIASYTEWQVGATLSEHANNGRVTSVFMDIGTRIIWRHIHETWLPDSIRAAEKFDF